MSKSLIALVLIVPILVFAIIVWMTMAHIITGWLLIVVWIVGFIMATAATTAVMTIAKLQKYEDDKEDED
ncbi:hypothetical protein ABTQ33_04345 [Paucilactobacillus suebicus]|uniref:Uncharacterized protein n=1 Tax=Paucilactobacillus suebicus DSM 5007 = KCTC 3549 TaxID=1423807 RepID=A0A0R1W4N2_9LACO|nr:hypothetical protein [Paucilactobacillus suebicus]KRM10868.1 hypothetical protein FD16_GL001064 [Paucilactobacillus suebicus DSM 5007 = KCTC 3549]